MVEISHKEAIGLLRMALGRLLHDSMYKDHPEASQMAIDALKATGPYLEERLVGPTQQIEPWWR